MKKEKIKEFVVYFSVTFQIAVTPINLVQFSAL